MPAKSLPEYISDKRLAKCQSGCLSVVVVALFSGRGRDLFAAIHDQN